MIIHCLSVYTALTSLCEAPHCNHYG